MDLPRTPKLLSRKSSVMGADDNAKSGNRLLQKRNSFALRSAFKYAVALEGVSSNDDDESVPRLEQLRLYLKKLMNTSVFGTVYEQINILISIISTIEFIHSTYQRASQPDDRRELQTLAKIDIVFCCLFVIDWIFNYFLADNRGRYFFSFFSMVDVLTICSTLPTIGKSRPNMKRNQAITGLVKYTLCLFRNVRILRSLRVQRVLSTIKDQIKRFLFMIILNASVILLFFAATMQYVERDHQNLPFHTWMYYIWVTMATVGYGDFSPQSSAGRIAAMAMIGFGIISVPKVTNELIEKMKMETVYMRAAYVPKSRNSKHIVICGDMSSTSLNDFFGELFHEDHENDDMSAVMLLPVPPTIEIQLLLQDSKYVLNLCYLEGSALNDKDLKRAKTETAVAIFIMTNKFGNKPDEEDAKSILLNLSIKRYMAAFKRKDLLYCMQLIRPENRRHLMKKDANESEGDDLVVCLNEIKMGAMAKGILYPGANTLIMNLVSSFSDESFESNEEKQINELENETGKKVIVSSDAWLEEYQKGCGWEIYTTFLAPVFEGAVFQELSWSLYEKHGVVLFALQITDKKDRDNVKLLLNPEKYVIPSQNEYLLEGFVIAKNKAASDLSFQDQGQDIGIYKHVNRNLGSIANILLNSNTPGVPLHVMGSIGENSNSSNVGNNSISISMSASAPPAPTDGTAANNVSHEKRPNSGSNLLALTGSGNNKTHPATSGSSSNHEYEQLANTPTKAKQSPCGAPIVQFVSQRKSSNSHVNDKLNTNGYQELLHKLEDEHFIRNYYVVNPRQEYLQCFVKTNVMEEVPFINNHLIIIGKGLRNLYDFIRPFRAKYLGPLRYIVILYPHDIPHDVWQRISVFDAILVVRGSALEESNLRRAGIFRASQVVLLADGSGALENSNGMEALVDSDAIFCYQHIKRMNPKVQVVVEIVNQSNIAYLDDNDVAESVTDPKFTPPFAAGNLFPTSLLDSIVCQTYYNPQIIKVINKLISGVDQVDRSDFMIEAAQRLIADAKKSKLPVKQQKTKLKESSSDSSESDTHTRNSNNTKNTKNTQRDESSSDSDTIQTPSQMVHAQSDDEDEEVSDNKQSIRINDRYTILTKSTIRDLQKRGKSELNQLRGSCLYQMEIPNEMIGKNYGELYRYLSKKSIIPLGLLRGLYPSKTIGPNSNSMPYVYTNPDKETEVYACDRIFILSCDPPNTKQTRDIKDYVLNLQMQQSRSRPGSSEQPTSGRPQSALNKIRGSSPNSMQNLVGTSVNYSLQATNVYALENAERQQKRLDERVNRFTSDINKQIQQLAKLLEAKLQIDFQLYQQVQINPHTLLSTNTANNNNNGNDDSARGTGGSGGGKSALDNVLSTAAANSTSGRTKRLDTGMSIMSVMSQLKERQASKHIPSPLQDVSDSEDVRTTPPELNHSSVGNVNIAPLNTMSPAGILRKSSSANTPHMPNSHREDRTQTPTDGFTSARNRNKNITFSDQPSYSNVHNNNNNINAGATISPSQTIVFFDSQSKSNSNLDNDVNNTNTTNTNDTTVTNTNNNKFSTPVKVNGKEIELESAFVESPSSRNAKLSSINTVTTPKTTPSINRRTSVVPELQLENVQGPRASIVANYDSINENNKQRYERLRNINKNKKNNTNSPNSHANGNLNYFGAQNNSYNSDQDTFVFQPSSTLK